MAKTFRPSLFSPRKASTPRRGDTELCLGRGRPYSARSAEQGSLKNGSISDKFGGLLNWFFWQIALSQNWFWPKFIGFLNWILADFQSVNSKILWFFRLLVKNGVLWNWKYTEKGVLWSGWAGREKGGLVHRTVHSTLFKVSRPTPWASTPPKKKHIDTQFWGVKLARLFYAPLFHVFRPQKDPSCIRLPTECLWLTVPNTNRPTEIGPIRCDNYLTKSQIPLVCIKMDLIFFTFYKQYHI